MGPRDLAHVLRPLANRPSHPDLLLGLATADDAALWRIDSDRALVQTVDFFTPVVDDAYTYGAIAAANSLSDVYAMGGEPFLALAIAGFPESLPRDIIADVFRGAADKAAEGGVIVAGGHTVMDEEPKYGLCVTGMVHPDRALTKGALAVGDGLFLTKPLGTGVITTAHKKQLVSQAHLDGAVAWMTRLNRDAARVLGGLPHVRACTDVTGFGLLGHGYEMAAASGAAEDLLPGGADRNRAYLDEADESGRPRVSAADGVDALRLALLYDPQTSGGLLFGAPATEMVERAFETAGQPVWRIGSVAEGRGVLVR